MKYSMTKSSIIKRHNNIDMTVAKLLCHFFL